jgi:hypothetical protein
VSAPRPRTLALTDAIIAALKEGPATPDEIAARIGCLPCRCAVEGRVGRENDGVPCWCVRNRPLGSVVEPGWRPVLRHDLYRLLGRLRSNGVICRLAAPPGGRGAVGDTWTLIVPLPIEGRDLETWWQLPARAEP